MEYRYSSQTHQKVEDLRKLVNHREQQNEHLGSFLFKVCYKVTEKDIHVSNLWRGQWPIKKQESLVDTGGGKEMDG